MAQGKRIMKSRVAKSNRSNSTALTKQAFKSMLNARRELKYNTITTTTTVPNTGTVLALTQAITEGDTGSQRSGVQIELVKMHFRLSLVMNASAATDFVRVLIVADSMNQGASPAALDLLSTVEPNASLTANVQVWKRFKVLLDRQVPMSINGSSRAVVIDAPIKMNHIISYLGATDVAGSNGRGSIYLLLTGTQATNTTTYQLDVANSFYDS